MTGRIVKALSGFYYVDTGAGEPVPCRGRGKLRHQRLSPLDRKSTRLNSSHIH